VISVQHVVLLGDSILDNAAYVGSGADVVRQLQGMLPQEWRASLLARDGAVVDDIASQMSGLPADADRLVLSVGGNDALMLSMVLNEAAASMAAALERLAALREGFQVAYRAMLKDVLARNIATAVCTIYEPRYADPQHRRIAATALSLLNDAITREVFMGATLIDLRLICNDDDDFATPIEPSARGGAKIARAIAAFAQGRAPSSVVIAAG
jgi:hypothetical protein